MQWFRTMVSSETVMKKRLWIGLGLATGIVLTAATAMAWWAVDQTRQVPEFYAEATHSSVQSEPFARDQMNAGVKQLQNDAAKIGSWHAAFTDRQINAWLASELPLKFPQLLARGATEPRVSIQDGGLRVAARYVKGRLDTVVSCRINVQLTQQPNMLAVHVSDLRAGALPLPLSRFINGISRAAAEGDVSIQWDETEDGPVALVRVPPEHSRYVVSPVIVESVELSDHFLRVAGHSGPMAESVYRPHGPLHEFVSFRPRSRTAVRTESRWQ